MELKLEFLHVLISTNHLVRNYVRLVFFVEQNKRMSAVFLCENKKKQNYCDTLVATLLSGQ